MKFRLKDMIAFFILIAFCQPVFAQVGQVGTAAYVSVSSPMLYEGKTIPGFIQDIPADFKDIISLHETGKEVELKEVDIIADQVIKELEITPENDTLLLKSAILYYERKDFDKAEKLFENLVDRSAKRKIDEDSFFYLGLIAAQRKAYKECKYYFVRVIGENRRRINAYINLGVSLCYLGEYQQARIAFETANIIDLDNPVAYFYQGLANYKNGKQEEAIMHFRLAKILKADDPVFKKWVDPIKTADNNIVDLLSKIKTSPTNTDYLVRLGNLYVKYGEIDNAENCFNKVLSLDPKVIGAYTGLSEVYLFKGGFRKAELFAMKILDISPNWKADVYSRIGRINFHAKEYERAEYVLKKAISEESSIDYYPRALLGQLYVLQGKIKEAEKELKICRQTGKQHPEIDELEMKIARYKRVYGLK